MKAGYRRFLEAALSHLSKTFVHKVNARTSYLATTTKSQSPHNERLDAPAFSRTRGTYHRESHAKISLPVPRECHQISPHSFIPLHVNMVQLLHQNPLSRLNCAKSHSSVGQHGFIAPLPVAPPPLFPIHRYLPPHPKYQRPKLRLRLPKLRHRALLYYIQHLQRIQQVHVNHARCAGFVNGDACCDCEHDGDGVGGVDSCASG